MLNRSQEKEERKKKKNPHKWVKIAQNAISLEVGDSCDQLHNALKVHIQSFRKKKNLFSKNRRTYTERQTN